MASLTTKVIITAKIIINTDLLKIGFFFTIMGATLSAISITMKLKMNIENESNSILSHHYFKNLVLVFIRTLVYSQTQSPHLYPKMKMGSAGFEPTTSGTQNPNHAKLDHDPDVICTKMSPI
ncbi:protein of unknown function [Candidatus Nitrosotalea okcheonensis]|uniref:Uncharacterized protein n=1 Tax=Candidatus Nitrosotalea okcheonensis TaxID=1903276 RepID=A0A2H1FF07_9ARCH|nr:protein of unknown function [Candidatus Nitrosotalea okcheonensis]